MKLLYPLIGKVIITQKFGERPEVYKQFGLNGHNGLDLRADNNELFAPADGKVLFAGWENVTNPKAGYGIYLKMQCGQTQITFGHLKECRVKTGNSFKQGDLLAISDNTGFSTAPHLHITLKTTDNNGNVQNINNGYKGAIDPIPFFQERDFMEQVFSPLEADDLNNPDFVTPEARIAIDKLRAKGLQMKQPNKPMTKNELAIILDKLELI